MLFSMLTVAAALPSLAVRPQQSNSATLARLADTLSTGTSDELTFLEEASSTVNDILLQAGNATEHLSAADQGLLEEVKRLIKDDMYGSMKTKRDGMVTEMNRRYKAIGLCNADIDARQSDTGDLGLLHKEARLLQTQLNHLQEVVNEKTHDNNTQWGHFDDHMQTMGDAPACPDFPNPRGMATLDVYFKQSLYSIWWTAARSPYYSHRDRYLEADEALRQAIAAFNIHKAKLDVKYCDYRVELEAACASYDQCYASAVEAYNGQVADIKADVPKNLAIQKAAETLLAQVRFLLAQQKNRDTPPYDTSVWEVAYKAVPGKTLCDLSTLTTGWSHVINCDVCEQGFGIGHTFGVKRWSINGKCANALTVQHGDSVDVHLEYESWEHGCSGCIEQMYVGIRGESLDCIYNGNPNGHLHDDHTLTLANLAPGTYQIVATATWQYSCVERTDGRWIGTVHVQ